MIQAGKGARGYKKSEDPIYALENGLALDMGYYLEHQLKKPLIRIFKRITPNPETQLFVGEHTKNRCISKMGGTGLGKFFSAKVICLNCKTVIKEGALCPNCLSKRKGIFIERQIEFNNFCKRFHDLWVQCQRCQNSLHENIICSK